MREDLISIIIPAYNVEKNIDRALKSACEQSFGNIEVLVIDDGSTDNTANVVSKLASNDNRITLIKKENGGAASARNVGIAKASGEYLLFLDADDYYPDKESISKLYQGVSSNDVDACLGSFCTEDKNGRTKEFSEYGLFSGYTFSEDSLMEYKDYQFDYGFQRGIYKRKLIIANNIRFPEIGFYEDPPFMVAVLNSANKIYCLKAITYVYTLGHLNNVLNKEKIHFILKGIEMNLRFARDNNLQRLFNLTIKRLTEEYARDIAEYYDDQSIRNEINHLLTEYMGENVDRIIRFKDKLFLENTVKANSVANSISYQVGLLVTFFPRKIIHGCERIASSLDLKERFFSYISWITPLKEKQILFITTSGCYECNPKYITEELLRRKNDYHILFAQNGSSNYCDEFPEEIETVRLGSLKYYQSISSSKVIITNSSEFTKCPIKKNKQTWVQTWHGSLGIKRFDVVNECSRDFIRTSKKVAEKTDYVISNSKFEDDVYRDSFWKKSAILRLGHARNDILLNGNNEIKEIVARKLGLDIRTTKYALYGPTFRDGYGIEEYSLDYNNVSNALERRFGGRWKILLRLHPALRGKASFIANSERVIDISDYPDIQEIMLITDVGITDYSSWIYDFILTRKPGFIFATDVESYAQERGFYYSLSETPFPIATDNKVLVDSIISFDEKEFIEKVESFIRDKNCVDDGKSSQRIADQIDKFMKK